MRTVWKTPGMGLCVCLSLLLAGCGGNGLIEYSGVVRLDGEPLADGTIEFRPADRRGPTAAAVITDEKYTIRLAPGKKIVVVQCFRTVGEGRAVPDDPESPIVPIREGIQTQQYTQQSQTTIDVTSSRNDCDFELTTSQ